MSNAGPPAEMLSSPNTGLLMDRSQGPQSLISQQGSPPSATDIQLRCNSGPTVSVSSQPQMLSQAGHIPHPNTVAVATAANGAHQITPIAQPANQSLLSTNTAPVTNQHREVQHTAGNIAATAAAAAAVAASLHHHQQPTQPVEFNHAINYVNKIKVRNTYNQRCIYNATAIFD